MHHGKVRFVVLVLEVRVEGEQLVRRQHALVDDDLGGQADEEQQQALGQALVAAQAVGRGLADEVELAFQGIPFEVAADEQLFDRRHRRPGRIADIRLVRSRRHMPPTQQALPGVGDLLLDHRFATRPFARIAGQEDDTGPVVARCGQLDAEVPLCDPCQEPMR